MHPWLSLIIWVVIIIIIFCIMYYCGYNFWSSLAFAVLLGLIALVITYPWIFRTSDNRHDHSWESSDDDSCEEDSNIGFYLPVLLSIIILIAYIIGCVFDTKDSYMKNILVVPSNSVSYTKL